MGIDWKKAGLGLATGGASLAFTGINKNEEYSPYNAGGTPADAIASGSAQGRKKGEEIYGQSYGQTGQDVQDIISRRRQMMNDKGPAGTALLQTANQNIAQDRAVRASQGRKNDAREQQLARSGQVQAAQADYNTMLQNLGQYQSTIGNVASGQAGLEQGYAGLALGGVAPNPVKPPSMMQSGILGGGGGTVICTELWKQGYMDDYTYDLDRLHGIHVRTTKPHVYFGYLLLADPVVKLMQSSKLFTKLISIPALAWANHMAYENNIFGAIINAIGETICGTIGKLFCQKSVRIYNER